MQYSHLQERYCNGISYIVATIYNYFLNFYWSFTTKSSHRKTICRYVMIVSFGVFLNTFFVSIFTHNGLSIETSAILFSFIWPFFSFSLMKLWAFKDPPNQYS